MNGNLSGDQFGQPMEATCDGCEGTHPAEYHHEGQHGEGPIYEVACPQDGLSSFHTTEGVRPAKKKRTRKLDLSR